MTTEHRGTSKFAVLTTQKLYISQSIILIIKNAGHFISPMLTSGDRVRVLPNMIENFVIHLMKDRQAWAQKLIDSATIQIRRETPHASILPHTRVAQHLVASIHGVKKAQLDSRSDLFLTDVIESLMKTILNLVVVYMQENPALASSLYPAACTTVADTKRITITADIISRAIRNQASPKFWCDIVGEISSPFSVEALSDSIRELQLQPRHRRNRQKTSKSTADIDQAALDALELNVPASVVFVAPSRVKEEKQEPNTSLPSALRHKGKHKKSKRRVSFE